MTADFPVDPQRAADRICRQRYDKEPGPWDEVSVESVRAELTDQHAGRAGRGPARDDAIDALAKRFRVRRSRSRRSAEFDTDTFPKVEAEPAATEQSTPSTVPNQQRGGIRAFAERAMGGR